jgi:DNA-binding winged helix-turn-helix (wHTH) protein/tetratricopeptide (TPR) repeat protein
MGDDLPQSPIDLALEPAFQLAGLDVRPATLEVLAGERREQLQARVMQVLVALARRRGEVVSRDELIQRCWGGRIVGDDSINRCILQLRKLAQDLGGFEIETVPRVGFRLAEAASAGAGGRRWSGHPVLVAGAVLLLLLAGLGAFIWLRPAAQPATTPRVAVAPFRALAADTDAQRFSATLADAIEGVMGENALGVATIGRAGDPGPPSADFQLGGAVAQEAGEWRVRAYLEDRASRTVIWSASFARPRSREPELRDQIAVAVTETLYNLHMSLAQKGVQLDPATRALHLRATAALIRSQQYFVPGEARRLLEQVIARAPRFGEAHGQLALTLINEARTASPAERAALLQRGRREAELGIRLTDPSDSSYGALYRLARLDRSLDIATAEKRFLLSRIEVSEQPWAAMNECRLQTELGRARAALRACERGIALRPLATQVGYSYAVALQMAGDQEAADREIDRMFRYYPQHDVTRRVRLELAAFGGSADRALAILEGPNHDDIPAEGREALAAILQARKSGSAPDQAKAMILLWSAARHRQLPPSYLVGAAATFGFVDEAFRALEEPGFSYDYGSGFLFARPMTALHAHPRFWRLAAQQGYVDYWRGQGAWPDFCDAPGGSVDCRKAAAAAVAAGASVRR